MKKLLSAGKYLFIAFIFGLAGYNIISNYKSFLTFQIKDFIAIMMALVVSYYLSHKKNDHRKLKEEADDVIEKIQTTTLRLRDYDTTDETKKPKILVIVKNINSKFDILRKVSNKTGITKEVEYCINELAQYSALIEVKTKNKQRILENQAKLYEYLSNIDNTLDEVQIKLYQ